MSQKRETLKYCTFWRANFLHTQEAGKMENLRSVRPRSLSSPVRHTQRWAIQARAKVSSIKHDLARSCFQLWPKIGDEVDKISRKKTGEALAETVFSRNFVTLGADFEGHN